MSKPKLWAVMIYYQDANLLKKNIWSLDFVDGIILIDGAFNGFDPVADKNKNHWSSDESNRWIDSFLETHPKLYRIWYTRPGYGNHKNWHSELHEKVRKNGWQNEIHKRSFSISLVPDGDFFLIVDTDEKVFCHPELFRKELYSTKLNDKEITRNVAIIHHPDDTGWFFFPRVFKKVPGMHYKASHSNIFVGDDVVNWNPPYNAYRGFKSLVIIHEGDFYEAEERKIMKWNYINRRLKEEDTTQWKRDQLKQEVTPDRASAVDKLIQAKRKTGVKFILHEEFDD